MDKFCQMEDKSCGGCCCIEIPDDSKQDLTEAFRFRSHAYISHLAEKGDVEGYEVQIATREKLLSVDTLKETLDKKCHYLGFLNDEETKIGCLAHPKMNGEKDLRNFGFYKSAEKCQGFLCAAAEIYENFAPEQKSAFIKSIREWGWYDLSNQDRAYEAIRKFSARQ